MKGFDLLAMFIRKRFDEKFRERFYIKLLN
jgi:hypothetical protein